MSSALNRLALAALLVVAALFAGCSDEPGPGTELNPELTVAPQNATLGIVCLDGTSTAKFKVTNSGTSDLHATVELAGANPEHFAIEPTSATLLPAGEQEITVTYHPTGDVLGQRHSALVRVKSDGENGDGAHPATVDVLVDGETASAEPLPVLAVDCDFTTGLLKCTDPNRDSTQPCCRVVDLVGNDDAPYRGRKYLSMVEFGEIQANREVTVPLRVSNLGCGTLDLSELVFTPIVAEGFCEASTVEVGATLPLSVPGSVTLEQRQSAVIPFTFTPPTLCTYSASVELKTNDPDLQPGSQHYETAKGFARFQMTGTGTQGRIRTDPTAWYAGNIAIHTSVERVVSVVNTGNRSAEIGSVTLQGTGNGSFEIVKVERPNCEGAPSPLTAPFTLEGTDQVSNCGNDQANVTLRFTPAVAGRSADTLKVDYGDGEAAVGLTGDSNPALAIFPTGQILFKGPNILQCKPETCESVTTCMGVCATDDDCIGGNLCLDGVCMNEGACTMTCAASTKTVRVCNEGIAPLKFDDAAQGGGIVVTGRVDENGQPTPVPVHPDGTPMFSVIENECADAQGNGKSLDPAACCEAKVQFIDSRYGGVARANLHIYTNDPAYPREALGFERDLLATTDKDYDPVAAFRYYDDAFGPPATGDGQIYDGRMAVLDGSVSYDPACIPGTDPNCEPQRFNPIRTYSWKLTVGGTGDYATLMSGPINLDNPNANCPSWINGGKCFEVPDILPKGRVIKFYPDKDNTRTYKVELTVTDGVCTPEHTNTVSNDVAAMAPP